MEFKGRSLASLKRAKQKENKELKKDYHVKDFEAGHTHGVNTDREVEDSWNYLKDLLKI